MDTTSPTIHYRPQDHGGTSRNRPHKLPWWKRGKKSGGGMGHATGLGLNKVVQLPWYRGPAVKGTRRLKWSARQLRIAQRRYRLGQMSPDRRLAATSRQRARRERAQDAQVARQLTHVLSLVRKCLRAGRKEIHSLRRSNAEMQAQLARVEALNAAV